MCLYIHSGNYSLFSRKNKCFYGFVYLEHVFFLVVPITDLKISLDHLSFVDAFDLRYVKNGYHEFYSMLVCYVLICIFVIYSALQKGIHQPLGRSQEPFVPFTLNNCGRRMLTFHRIYTTYARFSRPFPLNHTNSFQLWVLVV